MEIYTDEYGNEFTRSSLEKSWGSEWQDKVAELGLKLKGAKGAATESATVVPLQKQAPVGTVLDSVDTSSDGLKTDPDPEGFMDGIGTDSKKIVVPKDRKYTDIIDIPSFKQQKNKDIASAYNNLYGGEDGGFDFEFDNNSITIKALNGNTITVNTNETKGDFANPGAIFGKPDYSFSDVKTSNAEELINSFIKNNFDEDLNKEFNEKLGVFKGDFKDNLSTYVQEYASQEDIAVDPTQPVSDLLQDDDFRAFVTKKSVDSYNEINGTGGWFQEDGVVSGKQFDTSIGQIMNGVALQEINSNEEYIRKTIIQPLKDRGEWAAETSVMKQQHVDSIVNKEERSLAQMGQEINRLAVILQQEGGNPESYQRDAKKLEQLINARRLAFKSVMGNDAKFLFDPITGFRIDKNIVSDSSIDIEDLSDQFDATKVDLREKLDNSDFETIKSDYNLHNVEYGEFQEKINTEKFDISVGEDKPRSTDPFLPERSKRNRPSKDTRRHHQSLGEWIGNLENEDGGKKYKAKDGVYKDVSLKDLMIGSMGINPSAIYGEGQKIMKAGGEDEISLARYVENSKQTQKRIALERSAWKTLYLLNMDPGSIKANDVVSQFSNFATAVFDNLPGMDKDIRRGLWENDRDLLTDSEALINKVNDTRDETQPLIELTEEQKDSFEVGFGEELWTGLGGFVPMIAELAAVSYMTGGMGTAAGIGNYLSKLKTVTYLSKVKGTKNSLKAVDALTMAKRAKRAKMSVDAYAKSKKFTKASGSTFQKFQALGIQALQEEGKMALLNPLFGVDMPTGAGAGFIFGGAAIKKFIPNGIFKGGYAGLNFTTDKIIAGGIGGFAGAQVAAPLEAMIADWQNKKDFMTFVDEKYPSLEEWGKHALLEVMQFSLIGVHHLSKADLTVRMASKRNLLVKTVENLNKTAQEGNKEKVLNDIQLVNELKRQIAVSENRMKYLDKSVLSAETYSRLEKFNREFAKDNGGEAAFNFKLQVNNKGMTKGNIADVDYSGKKPKITIDMSKVDEGTLPHELYHIIKENIFKSDPSSQVALQAKLANAVKSMDFKFSETAEGKTDLKSKVEEAYEKTQDASTMPEEFVANLVGLLQSPEHHDALIAKNLIGQVRYDILSFFEKNLAGTPLERLLPKLNTPEKMIKFLSIWGKSTGKGNYNKGLNKRYENMVFDAQSDLRSIEGGKLNKSKEEIKTDKLAQRELKESSIEASKVNETAVNKYEVEKKKLEDNKDMNPEIRGKISDGLESKLKGELFYNNQGLLQEYINKIFKPGLGITRETFEQEVIVELLDKIIPPYLRRGKEMQDVPFGAYARGVLHGGGGFGGGRVGNILRRLGQTEEGIFKKDLDSKEAQSKMSETNEFEFGEEVVEQKLTDPKTLDKFPGGKTESMDKLVEAIEIDLEGRDLSKDTFKSLSPGKALAKAWGEVFGLNPKLMYDIAASGGKKGKEVSSAQTVNEGENAAFLDLRMFINNNSQKIVNILPEAKTLENTATGVPDTVKKLFYKKNSKGDWQIRNNISHKEVQDAMTAPSDAVLYRSKQVQIIKGINKLIFKGLVNKVARDKLVESGASQMAIQQLASGKNPRMAQKALEYVNESLPDNLKIKRELFSFYSTEYQKDPEEFRKQRPVIAEGIENLLVEVGTKFAQLGKEKGSTSFKKLTSGDPTFIDNLQKVLIKANPNIDVLNIFNGTTGKGVRKEVKKGGEKILEIFDLIQMKEMQDVLEEHFLPKLPRRVVDEVFGGETTILLASSGLSSRGSGLSTLTSTEIKARVDAVVKENIELERLGKPLKNIPKQAKTLKVNELDRSQEIGDVDFIKNQKETFSASIGTSKSPTKLFDGLLENTQKFKSISQQKGAVKKAHKVESIEEKAEILNKVINEADNKLKRDITFAWEGMKQEILYDTLKYKKGEVKTEASEKQKALEFERVARFIYQQAANNSSLTDGLSRMFVGVEAVYNPKGIVNPEKLKLEHVKISLRQSMQTAEAVVGGKWIKDGKKILEDYEGIISFERHLDVIDDLGLKTNDAKMNRMFLDLENLKNYTTTKSGNKQTLYDELMVRTIKRINAKGRITDIVFKEALAKAILEPSDANDLVLKSQIENKAQTLTTWEANNNLAKKAKVSETSENQAKVFEKLNNRDKAIRLAQRPLKEIKKARVFDFDDTLARSKSKILFTLPDGKKGKLNAAEFAKKSEAMEAEGVKWDFSEFSKVIDGKKGPLFELAKMISESPGSRDMFVLTARPAESAPAIHKFLKGLGLDIPVENITGLANGAPTAKSNWILEKAAEGYNDFYFADDHLGNVKAVKQVLDVIDVKSKVQQAFASRNLNKTFNDIIEEKTGIGANKVYSDAKATQLGKKKGRWDYLISPGAEDFLGLMYKTLPKGVKGEKALEFYNKTLLEPFARAEDNLTRDQVTFGNDISALKKALKIKSKELKKINETGFTNEHAVRVRMWSKMGIEIPGLSKGDLVELNKVVIDNPQLEAFADQLLKTTKGDGWAKPITEWVAGDLTSDARNLLATTKRAKYLEEWSANVKELFTNENLSKLEVSFGKDYRKALEKTLNRMTTGKNRTSSSGVEGRVLDYINNSVGTIMFLNTRSAVLQTISSANFINWTDNNPLAAGKALANRKQYASDFMEIMNSDYLVGRRNGLKLNINEAEIFDADGAKGIINTILRKGFVFTKYADSFAIAAGGATFYRNRTKTYMKKGMSEVDAKAKAFIEFKELSEESQQSSRTDKISEQQASNLGRVVLAFANTPMQYARIQKKAMLDLANGRGDWKTNVSKITYYGFVQNLMFNLIQNAMFGIAFGDDETDDKLLSKSGRVANGMADSILRGMGLAGAGVAMTKNAIMRVVGESEKKRPKYSKAIYDILNVSPTVGSKARKLRDAFQAAEWGAFNKDENGKIDFSLDSGATMAVANVISATMNIPVDRAIKKLQNIDGALFEDVDNWQRIAMALGFQDWELGVSDTEETEAVDDSIYDYK